MQGSPVCFDMLLVMSNEETAMLLDAIHFAAEAHCHQRRKGSEQRPYVNHCIWVSQAIAACGDEHATVHVLCAAVLHDTVEDTTVSDAALRQRFGDRVADLVAEVTDDKALPRATRKALQIEHAGAISPGACLIKIADKISNVRDLVLDPPPSWSRTRVLEYVDWSERVVSALAYQQPGLMTAFRQACEQTRAAFSTS